MAKVLIVDDEQHIRELFSIELEEAGYEVFTAASCYSLMKRVEKTRPDAIILDIRLVDCDGLEILNLLRDRYHDLPIILCSAYDSYKYEDRAIAADYYVIKSFDLGDLKTKLERALQASISMRPTNYCQPLREPLQQNGEM